MVTASLKDPESGRVSFGGGSESTEVKRLLSVGQMVSILLTKCLLRARRLSISAGTVSVGWSTWSSCEICEVDQLPRQIL